MLAVTSPVPLIVRVPSSVRVHDWSPESWPEAIISALAVRTEMSSISAARKDTRFMGHSSFALLTRCITVSNSASAL